MDWFEFCPNQTTDYGVTAHEHLKNECLHFFLVAVGPFHFNLAGKEDMREISK